MLCLCLGDMFSAGPHWARSVKRSRFGRNSATGHSVTRKVSHSRVNRSSGDHWSGFTDDTEYDNVMFSFGGSSAAGNN